MVANKIDKAPIALILAGGSGTRFWPMSRKDLPKQYLPLTSSH
ncbi:MAG: sugar phosphate nucleotidyltransferase, partial [Deltaproteobacteria bacterium]